MIPATMAGQTRGNRIMRVICRSMSPIPLLFLFKGRFLVPASTGHREIAKGARRDDARSIRACTRSGEA
jgi:hypothetical protein